MINTKAMTENKLKEFLSQLNRFKVQAVLVLDYKKRNDQKVLNSSDKLIASDSDIDKGFIYMQQSIMTKII